MNISLQATQKYLTRSYDFFGLQSNYKEFRNDVKQDLWNFITEVDIECYCYGYFDKNEIQRRFFEYMIQMLRNCKKIRSLKIIFNGFALQDDLHKLCRQIGQSCKGTIHILWFHTTGLTNCKPKDFQSILNLMNQLSDINFEQLSLIFSRWSFKDRIPNVDQLEVIFTRLVEEGYLSKIKNKKFRLELSSWYYQEELVKSFLKFKLSDEELGNLLDIKYKDKNKITQQLGKIRDNPSEKSRMLRNYQIQGFRDLAQLPSKVDDFHSKMQKFVRGLLDLMDDISEFELDLRNWHPKLNMKELKKKLDKIIKDGKSQKSMVSKKQHIEAIVGENQESTLVMIFRV